MYEIIMVEKENTDKCTQYDCSNNDTGILNPIYNLLHSMLFIVEIIKENMLTITKCVNLYSAVSEHELSLVYCGLKLSIPKAVITPEESIYEVAVEGLWGKGFKFPEGTSLISSVCCITFPTQTNCPVTVQLDHCAEITGIHQTKCLSFATTEPDMFESPYQFKLVTGGIFNKNSCYGTLELNIKKICILAIVLIDKDLPSSRSVKESSPSLRYRCYQFHKKFHSKCMSEMSIAVSQDLEYFSQVAKHHSGFLGIEKNSFKFEFTGMDSEIEKKLKFSNLTADDENKFIDGWRITFSAESMKEITESSIRAFSQFGGELPYISLIAEASANTKNPLKHVLNLEGISGGHTELAINGSITKADINKKSIVQTLTTYDKFKSIFNVMEKLQVDSSGIIYRCNQYGVTINIPEGAVTEPITLWYGANLSSDRFQLKDFVPVSPIVWIYSSSQLLKPAEVYIPHHVSVIGINKSYIKSRLFLLTASDDVTQKDIIFDSQIESFQVCRKYVMISTEHFCSYCLAEKKDTALKKHYQICRAMKTTPDNDVLVNICFMYDEKKCREKIKEQYKEYEVDFHDVSFEKKPEIALKFEPQAFQGWAYTFVGAYPKSLTEIDVNYNNILTRGEEKLEELENELKYPPRFCIKFSQVTNFHSEIPVEKATICIEGPKGHICLDIPLKIEVKKHNNVESSEVHSELDLITFSKNVNCRQLNNYNNYTNRYMSFI
jgi:hypothetical protein